MTNDHPAMQMRCVHCLREQWAMAVFGVSTGQLGCTWCGKTSTVMSEQEYRRALAAARRKADE